MQLKIPNKEVQLSLVGEETAAQSVEEQKSKETRQVGEGKTTESPDVTPEEEATENLYQKIQQMTVAEKIKMAMLGNKEARTILLRESNKQVLLAVIHSPKITESEVEAISNSRNISDEVLREISKNREWCRNNKIISHLVKNPKTPLDISIRFMTRLDTKDLHDMTKSKNVPAALRTAVVRYLEQKEKKKKE